MELIIDFASKFLSQLRSPTLAFLLGGIAIGAFKSRLQIPQPIYQFVTFMLLMSIGLHGGMEIKETNFLEMIPLIVAAIVLGILIVFLGRLLLAYLPGVKKVDGLATAGLFGSLGPARAPMVTAHAARKRPARSRAATCV